MKDFVDALLDRVLDQDDMVRTAIDGASRSREAAKRTARLLAKAKDRPRAQIEFRKAFIRLLLAELAYHLPDAIRVARDGLRAEALAARKVEGGGPGRRKGLLALKPLTKPDLMRRAAERKGLTDGEAAATS